MIFTEKLLFPNSEKEKSMSEMCVCGGGEGGGGGCGSGGRAGGEGREGNG